MRALNVAFVVQGEGRGHMTQAIALAAMLRDAGHIVTKAMIGSSAHRLTPTYFAESIDAPVIEFEAPVQVPDRNRQGISNTRTLLDAVKRSPRFLKSMATISKQTESVDIVVNFLDLMAALAPCVFGYGEIGRTLKETHEVTPYEDWIDTYSCDEYQSLCTEVGALIDQAIAERLGPKPTESPRWVSLCQHFDMATRLEIGFWDMGMRP